MKYMNTLKKLSLPSMALIVLMTAACSNTDPDNTPADTNAIRFSATVPKAPRGAATTTTTINSFTVNAYTGNKPYMTDVKVKRSGSSWTYSPIMYWPTTPVTFFAYSPTLTNTPVFTSEGTLQIPSYTNNGDVDLLYAVNMNETAKATPVQINFRHALSRVSALLSSANSALKVVVHYVTLDAINMRGTFTFPMQTTAASQPDAVGSWSDLELKGDQIYFYAMADEDAKLLTTTPTDLTLDNLNINFFIPQPLTELTFDGNAYKGNCIEVDCEIYDTATGAKLWPNSATPSSQLVSQTEYGRLMFPVTTATVNSWKPGYEYIYNIVIDNPDVLHPIDFNVTVDEYKMAE